MGVVVNLWMVVISHMLILRLEADILDNIIKDLIPTTELILGGYLIKVR